VDLQHNNKLTFSEFAEQILSGTACGSITAYSLSSLLVILHRDNIRTLDAAVIRYWLAAMLVGGKKLSTVRRYFGKIHSLYNEWQGRSDEDPFEDVRPSLDLMTETPTGEYAVNFGLIKRLLNRSVKSEDHQLISIFFYLLYSPEATIADVVNLTFQSAPCFCHQIDDIISSRDSSHGRKYVFDLKQGKSRPNEICRKLVRQLMELLSSVGMNFTNGFSRDSITSLWITAAVKAGVDICDIRACLSTVPKSYPAISVLAECKIDESRRKDIICKVADSINSHVGRWFVMKLRQGISVADIENRIRETLPGRLETMLLFSPSKKEIRKEGRKRVEEEIPYLPGILFFKTQTDKVKSLFANIGDLAWCYKNSNSPDGEYSVISHGQMIAFQRCIGQFTPDIKMELVDLDRPLERGRRVRVIGGVMAGYEGEILDVEGEPGRRIFYLSLNSSTMVKWTARVEDIFLEPLS